MKEVFNTVKIMDIDFINITKEDFLHKHLAPKLSSGQKTFVVTANPEIVMHAREDEAYKKIVQSADYVVPDGIGILLAAKYLKQALTERIAGFELMTDLLYYADAEGLSCYFLGAKAEVNEKAILEIKDKHSNLKIAGYHHGFFEIDNEKIFENVLEAQPDIVFVALGFPRQEKWIFEMMKRADKGLFIGVGGSFDVIAGEVKRAPEAWIKLNLEWLYRIIKQPFRAKRILKAFEFLFRILVRK